MTKISKDKIKILVVEDDPSLLKREVEALSVLGVKVISATSGIEAIKKISEEKPDVVFLDLVLPKMGGESIVRFIKGSESLKNISVIVITGKEDADTVEKCHKLGCDGFITKPIEPEKLVEKALIALEEKGLEIEE